MAVLPSQTRGKLNKSKWPHQCTSKSIVQERAFITHEREAQTDESTSSPPTCKSNVHGRASITNKKGAQTDKRSTSPMYGQVHRAWPCFHHKREGSSNKQMVLLTNVRASPSCMAVLTSKLNGELKHTKDLPHQIPGKSIVHGRAFIKVEKGTHTNERSSSPMYGQVHCAWPRFHHKREESSNRRKHLPTTDKQVQCAWPCFHNKQEDSSNRQTFTSQMYRRVHCAWPCFHHKREGSLNKPKVLLTNVRANYRTWPCFHQRQTKNSNTRKVLLTDLQQIHRAWPCFRHKQEESSNRQNVLLTNVLVCPSCMAVLPSQPRGKLKQTKDPP